jgi:hypothetical protein
MTTPLSPTPSRSTPSRRRIRLDPKVAGVGLAASAGLLAVLLVLVLARGGDDRVAAAASPSAGPSASFVTEPSGSPSAAPVASQAPIASVSLPTATPTAVPPEAAISFPIRTSVSPVLMAPGPSGGVYVTVPSDDRIVAALVGPDGAVRPGWPVDLGVTWCIELRAAADGTLRAICEAPPRGDGIDDPVLRVLGMDAAGRALPGWPVDVPGSVIEYGSPVAAMHGTDLTLVLRQYSGDTTQEGVVDPAFVALIGATGRLQMGEPIESECCSTGVVPGSGIGLMLNRDYVGDGSTEVTAFDLDGAIWEATFDAVLSNPSFDGAGNAYFSEWRQVSGKNRMLVVDGAGHVIRARDDVRIDVAFGYSGAGPEYPGAPVVAGDGSAYVVGNEGGSLSILALDASGRPKAGWPFEPGTGIAQEGFCGQADTGCGTFDVRPQVGSDGTLYVAGRPGAIGGGGFLFAVQPDGSERSGWPVGLRRGGAEFWDMVAASDGGVWALAAEPEGTERYSSTLLSIAPDSTVRGKLTIVEP